MRPLQEQPCLLPLHRRFWVSPQTNTVTREGTNMSECLSTANEPQTRSTKQRFQTVFTIQMNGFHGLLKLSPQVSAEKKHSSPRLVILRDNTLPIQLFHPRSCLVITPGSVAHICVHEQ